jgi:hypothetical protein
MRGVQQRPHHHSGQPVLTVQASPLGSQMMHGRHVPPAEPASLVPTSPVSSIGDPVASSARQSPV